jgi:segregation and condensation protein A
MDYLVKTGDFEGPVHVLLEMIQDRKLHVSEVALASVTEDFLRFMNDQELLYGQITSFIAIASTLVLIKARSLIPQMPLTDEEEKSIEDLTERIRQYQLVQKYAAYLAPRYQKNIAFERAWIDRNPIFAPDSQITLATLQERMEDLLKAFPVLEMLPEKAIKVVIKLEDVVANLITRIQSGLAVHSRDMMDNYKNASDPAEKRQAKVFAVVSFLAILELVKKGLAKVAQEDSFSNIELTPQSHV